MHSSPQDAALWHHLKHTGLVLLLVSVLVLLILLGWVGTGISHASQVGVPSGGLMAPGDNPGGSGPST